MNDTTKRVLDAFDREVEARRDTLHRIETEATELLAVVHDRQEVEVQLEDVASNVEELQTERLALLDEWNAASFEQDISSQQRIVRERNRIDADLNKLDKNQVKLSKKLESLEVDTVAAAHVHADFDATGWKDYHGSYRGILEFPNSNFSGYAKEIKDALEADDNAVGEIWSRTKILVGKLDYDTSEYQSYRSSLDEAYAVQVQRDEWASEVRDKEADRVAEVREREKASRDGGVGAYADTMPKATIR